MDLLHSLFLPTIFSLIRQLRTVRAFTAYCVDCVWLIFVWPLYLLALHLQGSLARDVFMKRGIAWGHTHYILWIPTHKNTDNNRLYSFLFHRPWWTSPLPGCRFSFYRLVKFGGLVCGNSSSGIVHLGSPSGLTGTLDGIQPTVNSICSPRAFSCWDKMSKYVPWKRSNDNSSGLDVQM